MTGVGWDALAGGAIAVVGVFILLAVSGPLALDGLGVDSLTIGTPDTFTFLFAFSSTPTEISMSVGPAVLGVSPAVGPVYALIRSYRRAKPPASEQSDEA